MSAATCCERPRSSRTWAAAKDEMPERDVVGAITEFSALWDELFPAEQARVLRLLVERVYLSASGMRVRLWAEGLPTLVEQLRLRAAA
jgi:site-specific DNA recombinase